MPKAAACGENRNVYINMCKLYILWPRSIYALIDFFCVFILHSIHHQLYPHLCTYKLIHQQYEVWKMIPLIVNIYVVVRSNKTGLLVIEIINRWPFLYKFANMLQANKKRLPRNGQLFKYIILNTMICLYVYRKKWARTSAERCAMVNMWPFIF